MPKIHRESSALFFVVSVFARSSSESPGFYITLFCLFVCLFNSYFILHFLSHFLIACRCRRALLLWLRYLYVCVYDNCECCFVSFSWSNYNIYNAMRIWLLFYFVQTNKRKKTNFVEFKYTQRVSRLFTMKNWTKNLTWKFTFSQHSLSCWIFTHWKSQQSRFVFRSGCCLFLF